MRILLLEQILHVLRPCSSAPIVSSSEAIKIKIKMLRNMPFILKMLQENVSAIRTVLDRIEALTIPSHVAWLIIRIHLRNATRSLSTNAKLPNLATLASRDAASFGITCCTKSRCSRDGSGRSWQ